MTTWTRETRHTQGYSEHMLASHVYRSYDLGLMHLEKVLGCVPQGRELRVVLPPPGGQGVGAGDGGWDEAPVPEHVL
eukprot:3941490-Rhodomonas_salina.2